MIVMPFVKADADRRIAVDVVFCIDATGSISDPTASGCSILDIAKSKITQIYTDLSAARESRGKSAIRQMRIRLVVFRDYIADGEHAMMVTDFFQLPQQAAELESCINSIHADGGGDIPEDGLEALAYAIKSKWTNEGMFRRHIIMLWTDADAHALGFGSGSKFYPKGMPNDLGELSDWWDDATLMKQNEKRLILFAPDEGNWKYISENWNLVWHIDSATGNDLTEKYYSEILNVIA